jgi:hypothetical protein
MTELKKIWDRIERWAIYAGFFLFLLFQFVAIFMPSISSFFDGRVEVILSTVVLLFVFRYLDEKLNTLDEQVLETSSSFLNGLVNILSERKVYDNVDVIAHTGAVYVRGFLESQAQIKNLRVLLRDMRDIERISLPTDDNAKRRIQQEWDSAILEWQQLRQEGRVENLTIQYYPFDPMMTFITIDKKKAYFDLMKPQKAFPGATSRHAPTCYIVMDRTAVGRQLISDISTVFEQLWTEFQEVDLAKKTIEG